jgi:hypothetical protein
LTLIFPQQANINIVSARNTNRYLEEHLRVVTVTGLTETEHNFTISASAIADSKALF